MTPALIEPERPKGLPTTKASLPTCALLGLPRTAGCSFAGGLLARRTAISFRGCVAWIWAVERVPSANVTSIDAAPATTCRAVRMSPLLSTTTPLPREPSAVTAPDAEGLLLGAEGLLGVAVPVAPWCWIKTSEGASAVDGRSARGGAGVRDASCWAAAEATSCCVSGRGPGVA